MFPNRLCLAIVLMAGVVADAANPVDEKEKEPNRDELYRQLLRDTERVAAIFKQQPGNRNSLRKELTKIRALVIRIRGEEQSPDLPSKRPSPETEVEVASAAAKSGKPAGPVSPDDSPLDEKTLRRLMDELEKTHQGGTFPSVKQEARSLKAASRRRIEVSCRVLLHEISRMLKLVEQKRFDSRTFRRQLDDFRRVVSEMDRPPAGKASAASD